MSGSCRDALPDVWECSEGPPAALGCPEVVGRPYQKFGRPSRLSGSQRWPSRMSRSGQEALPDCRELSDAFPDV